MPLVTLRYKTGRGNEAAVRVLVHELPHIVAPNLSLSDREQLDGQVNPDDIIVRCDVGSPDDVSTKDIEVIIMAHDFPDRAKNLDERKEAITEGVRRVLKYYGSTASGFVWVWLLPTAYGRI